MPVIAMPIAELKKRLSQQDLSTERLLEILAQLGSDIEDVSELQRYQCLNCGYIIEKTAKEAGPNACDQCFVSFAEHPGQLNKLPPVEVVRMELLAVRPDVFDVGGLTRMLKGYLGIEKGLKEYTCHDGDYQTVVSPEVCRETCFRPHIACAVLRGLRFDDYMVKSIMKLQENLHWALGRNRKLASIGVYDLDTITFPMHYHSTAKNENPFNPLPFSAWDKKPMLPEDILRFHPKGMMFSHLLADFSRYPLLQDDRGLVMSMPPIINSLETMVSRETKAIFVDVTGPYRDRVDKTLNIFVTALLEMQPDLELFQVKIKSSQCHVTPELASLCMDVSLADCSRLIGFDINQQELILLLQKARFAARALDHDRLKVEVPAYRADIMHAHDIYEDAAIMYGYHNLNTPLLATLTQGRENPCEQSAKQIRDIMTGLTFLEVRTLPLTNRETAFKRMECPVAKSMVHISNPASQEHEMLIHDLLPNLLALLAINKHNALPQQIFEISDVSHLCAERETGARDIMRMAAVKTDSSVGFSYMRAALQAFFRSLNLELVIRRREYPYYIPGRSGDVIVLQQKQEVVIGHVGEIHPKVLQNFKLENPVCAFELEIIEGLFVLF